MSKYELERKFLDEIEKYADANMSRYLQFNEKRKSSIDNYCHASTLGKWFRRVFDRKIYDDVNLVYQVEIATTYKDCKSAYQAESDKIESHVFVIDKTKNYTIMDSLKLEALCGKHIRDFGNLNLKPAPFHNYAYRIDNLCKDAMKNTDRLFSRPSEFNCFIRSNYLYRKLTIFDYITSYTNKLNKVISSVGAKTYLAYYNYFDEKRGKEPRTYEQWKAQSKLEEQERLKREAREREEAWAEKQREKERQEEQASISPTHVKMQLFGIFKKHGVKVDKPKGDEQIKQAFKKFVMKTHPDKHPEFIEDFKEASRYRDALQLNK